MSDEVEVREPEIKRRLPETLRKFLIRVQGNRLYLPTQVRVVWFREECPDWAIETETVEGSLAEGYVVVKAIVRNAEGRIIAEGQKSETQRDFPAGFIEKAETGAIGRALAVAGFGSIYAAELDELGDTEHVADAPVQRPVHSQAAAHPPAAAVSAAPAKPSAPVAAPHPSHAGAQGAVATIDYRARAAAHADPEIIALNARLKELAQEAGVDPNDPKAMIGMIAWHLGIDERDVKRPKDMSKEELKHLISELEQALQLGG